jgi:hypothetical protein
MAHRVRGAGAALREAAALAVILGGVWLVGCSEQGSAEKLASDSPLFVETSQTSLKMENRAGLALTDVNVVIQPYGPLEFSMLIPRMEATDKRDIPLNQFRSRDGTTFNARFHKPKSVRISGRDTAGKAYEIEIPWS